MANTRKKAANLYNNITQIHKDRTKIYLSSGIKKKDRIDILKNLSAKENYVLDLERQKKKEFIEEKKKEVKIQLRKEKETQILVTQKDQKKLRQTISNIEQTKTIYLDKSILDLLFIFIIFFLIPLLL